MELTLRKTACLVTALLILCHSISTFALPDFGEEPPHQSPLGMDISEMTAEELFGGEMSENGIFAGYDLTLMVVWVIWSGASDACMRVIEEQKESYAQQNINCIGVYYEDENHPVGYGRRYYNERGYTIYSITNRKSPVLKEVFARTEAYIPVIYFVDRAGTVRGFTSGYATKYGLNRLVCRFLPDYNIITFADSINDEVIYETIVKDGERTYYPNVPQHKGYKFKYWDGQVENITESAKIYAVYDKIGDVNYDGSINTGDAVLILRYVTEMTFFSEYTLDIADFNRSGDVNTGDVVAVLRFCCDGAYDPSP